MRFGLKCFAAKLSEQLKQRTQSILDQRIQNLISLIFDIEIMKESLLEMEVDIKKVHDCFSISLE